jgi:hypothetical protein
MLKMPGIFIFQAHGLFFLECEAVQSDSRVQKFSDLLVQWLVNRKSESEAERPDCLVQVSGRAARRLAQRSSSATSSRWEQLTFGRKASAHHIMETALVTFAHELLNSNVISDVCTLRK